MPTTQSTKGKIGRNDPCWCGSGRKYKKCHQNRQSEEPLPLEALVEAMRRAWQHKQCLHPLAGRGVCDQIVSAHSVQRSQTLEAVMDKTRHVCSFFPQVYQSDGSLKLHRVGWRDASTFTGFCAKHDSTTFAPIDRAEFNGSAEQCFLIGYRALCHEIYQKSGALRADPVIRQMVDRGQTPELQRHTQELFDVWGAGTSAGLQDFRRLKEAMDRTLLEKDYDAWPRAIISFKGPLCLASTGAATPDRLIDGRQLQVLHDMEKPIEELPFGVVTAPGGGAVVFSWRPGEKAQWQFIEELLGRQNNKLPSLLVQWMFAYVENTYFSVEWWESLPQMVQRHLNSLAEISNPYYTTFPFLPMKLVPWEITEISVTGAP